MHDIWLFSLELSYKQSCEPHKHQPWSRNDTHVECTDPTRASVEQQLSQLRRLASNYTKHWVGRKASLYCVENKLWDRILHCEASTSAVSANTPVRSQKGCCIGGTSGTSTNCVNQHVKYKWRRLLSLTTKSAKMSAWSGSVLATEATKAGSASKVTHLIPRSASRTGRLAWIHFVSERSKFVICWTKFL